MNDRKIDEIRKRYYENIPSIHNGAYRKVWKKAIYDRRLAAAVKAKCLDCCCWQAGEVKDCLCPACPLYESRPYVKHPVKRKPKTKAEPPANEPICAPE